MRDRTEFGRSSGSRGIVFPLICFAALFAVPARAQKTESKVPGPPKYDLQTETKIKVTVEEVKMPPKGSEKEVVHLMVKTGSDTLDVYLTPKSFLDDMGMDFSKGDEISLTGSKVKVGEADLILAREVVKGNNTFTLRDDKGGPVWNWHH
jgi:predicted PhzF superfamily epimerase YddE/YHI9